MKSKIFSVFIALVILGNLIASEEIPEDDVCILTDNNYSTVLKENKYVMVKFYAPWCGHCKKMAGDYSELAKKMKDENRDIKICKLDATEHKNTAAAVEIKGYPTLKFFINENGIDYQGAREKDAIYSWILKKTESPVKKISSEIELDPYLKQEIAVFLVADDNMESEITDFNTLALSNDDLSFVHVPTEFASKLETVGKSFIIHRKFDEGTKTLVNNINLTNMKHLLDNYKNPIVRKFDQKAAEEIFGSEKTAFFIFNDENTSDAINAFSNVAKKYTDSFVFCKSEIKDGLGSRLAEYVGVKESNQDTIVAIKFNGGNLLKYKIQFTDEEAIVKFIEDFKEGKLKEFLKSEDIPADNNEPVKVVVGKNFEDIVFNKEKHVLLEAYAPWCGHCKQLEPIYNKLAKELSSHDDIVIAKIDATANEHPSLNIKGFPTIKFYPKDNKTDPEDYSGERTLEAIVKYLEEKTNKKLSKSDNEEL